MGVDYDSLNNWRTPDLMLRDSALMGRTRVMGMSQTAAIIHIVAFVCTSGTSLPINLAFCIWHRHRYRNVKKERKMIRQILGSRNVAYQGRGHWVNVNPSPNAVHHWNPTPTGAQCVYNSAPGTQWMYNSAPGGQWVHNSAPGGQWVDNNPRPGHWVHGTPTAGHWVQPTPSGGHWVQPTPGFGQTVHATPTPHADNDFQQFTQGLDAVNDLQQAFGGNNNDDQAIVAPDQSFYNC